MPINRQNDSLLLTFEQEAISPSECARVTAPHGELNISKKSRNLLYNCCAGTQYITTKELKMKQMTLGHSWAIVARPMAHRWYNHTEELFFGN